MCKVLSVVVSHTFRLRAYYSPIYIIRHSLFGIRGTGSAVYIVLWVLHHPTHEHTLAYTRTAKARSQNYIERGKTKRKRNVMCIPRDLEIRGGKGEYSVFVNCVVGIIVHCPDNGSWKM